MTKAKIKKKKPFVIRNDTERNDDWMKTLPGYKDEKKIHEDLAKKNAKGKKEKGTIVKKGSSSSGHYGHAGLPGVWGGSVPSTGSTSGKADPAKKEEIFSRSGDKERAVKTWNKISPISDDVDVEDFILDAYEMEKIGETGHSSRVTSVWSGDSGDIVVEGEIVDSKGNVIGDFKKFIEPDGNVYHSIFEIKDKSAQGKGIGRLFYQNAEDAYVAAGLKSITLGANMDVGGYAWARMGFGWDRSYEWITTNIGAIRGRFANKLQIAMDFDPVSYNPDPKQLDEYRGIMGEFNTWDPWQIAAYDYQGTRVGKQALLGSSWQARKYLNEDDEGFQVGQLYYMSHE